MSKQIVITKETIKEKEYQITAVFENYKLYDAECLESGQESILENIYVGKVKNIVSNIHAAFIEYSNGKRAYYPLNEKNRPVFVKQARKDQLSEGDEILIQIAVEPVKSKDPVATTNLSFHGKGFLLTTENRKLGFSKKLNGYQQKYYRELLGFQKEWQLGMVVRSNVTEYSDKEIIEDLARKREEIQTFLDTCIHRNCFACVRKAEPSYIRQIKEINPKLITKITTDEESIFQTLQEQFQNQSEYKDKINFYQDTMVSLPKLYSLKTELENAVEKTVWLKSGAYLVIEQTEAMTVIDVNSGKNTKKNNGHYFYDINVEAAKEICRQLHLRNISGICIVDFINMKSAAEEKNLMHLFREELKKDTVPTQLVDITKLGLVEVTRKKRKQTLAQQLAKK